MSRFPAAREKGEKNPHFGQIEGHWVDLRPRLAAFDGQGAVQVLSRLMESPDSMDKRIWNALYWRTDSWIKSYLGRKPLTDGEKKAGLESHEVGGPRWSAWLHDAYPDRPSPMNWQADDLKFILQELRKMG